MKLERLAIIFAMMLITSTAIAAETTGLATPLDKASYAIGMDIAISLKRNNVEVNPDVLGKAMKDVLTNQPTQLSDTEAKIILADLQKEMEAKKQEEMKVVAEKNKKESEAFLAENMKKEGVKTLPSGLQYKIISEGNGKSPKETDTVTVQYIGKLVNGNEFDSSYKRGKAASFAVNKVIKGWTEALQLMKEGSKWQIFIPANLAYGEKGGGPIGPNAALIFDVELVSVKSE